MTVPSVSPPALSWVTRLLSRIAATPFGVAYIRDVGARIDPVIIRLTGGRFSTVWPMPAVLAMHRGAKSGRIRTCALVFFTDRDRVILIATNFGAPRNPAWYLNMKADPVVELYGRGIRGRFKAEQIHGADRDRVFQRAKDAPGAYGKYEEAANSKSRQVPVMALTPVGGQLCR